MRPILLLSMLAGCGSVPFANRHILWKVNDNRPIPMVKERESLLYGPGVRDELFRSADRVLRLDYGREAADVNALDEVPDSSWFEDPRRDPAHEDGRLRPISDQDMFEGPTRGEPPPVPPFTVLKGKTDGATAGFVVTDARGRKYLIKFDPPGWPQLATSTEVIATRIVWSLGWRVPKMWLFDLKPSHLILSKHATTKDEWFRTIPLTEERYGQILRWLSIDEKTPAQVALSLWLPGKPVGPYSYVGRRADDPNDLYPHEDRRDLRGFRAVCAWLNNIDTQEQNTLDTYVGEPGRGHLLHYQQDVGGTFGSRAAGPTEYFMGTERYFQTSRILFSLITFGVFPRKWEGEEVVHSRARQLGHWPELGYFDSEHFDPRSWNTMVYNPAFDLATTRDHYWGTKRVLAISERELRAAIAAGRYRPEVAERLFWILWARREKVARAYLPEVAALDHFRVDAGALCFDDIWKDAGLGGGAEYRVEGGVLDGKCVRLPSQRGYRVVQLRVKRPGERDFGPKVAVHLNNGNVVGVER